MMKFPSLYIIVDDTSKSWLGNSPQRNKTAAQLTHKGAPRLFTKRSAATQAMNAWMKGEHYYEHKWQGPEAGMDSGIHIRTVWERLILAKLRVVEVDLVMEEYYIDISDIRPTRTGATGSA